MCDALAGIAAWVSPLCSWENSRGKIANNENASGTEGHVRPFDIAEDEEAGEGVREHVLRGQPLELPRAGCEAVRSSNGTRRDFLFIFGVDCYRASFIFLGCLRVPKNAKRTGLHDNYVF